MTDPVVETTLGRLRGRAEDGVLVFRGIPYAASTAGANRFLPPQPAAPRAGIAEAAEWGPSAPQRALASHAVPFHAWYSAIRETGEDCLTLNVFTPARDGARRPVMVWLHGGGWRAFASTAPGFRGTGLARNGDVVLVTVNHRLGGFGFLRLADTDERFADAGNAGLLDLAMALRWVRDNAAAFGGDAGNVTIFGQSGGAAKVAALLAMPMARGLFHRAIVQSTSGGLRIAGPEEAARHAAALAQVLGWPRLDGAELQKLPVQTLIAAIGEVPGPFRPMIDGRTFAGDPFHPGAPASAAGVPVMAGCTATETTWYLQGDARHFALDPTQVQGRLMRFLSVGAEAVEAIVAAYREAAPRASPSEILIAVTTDQLFMRNTFRIAALQATTGAPVFAYVFAHPTQVDGGRLGAPHAAELPFIFGTTAAAAAMVGAGPDLAEVSARMIATWSAFARTGDPNNGALPRWARYREPDRQTMILGLTCELRPDPGGQARAALDALPFYEYGTARDSFTVD